MSRSASQLYAGAARVEITPSVPTPMAGYPHIRLFEGGPRDHIGYVGRSGPSSGCHDPLYARALAIGDAVRTVALVALDLCLVTASFTRVVRERVAEQASIAPEAILIAASHTHSGPDLVGYWEPAIPGTQEEACERVATAVLRAIGAMRPAAVGWGRGRLAEPIVNRRDPAGPTDPEVRVLRVEDEAGDVIAIVLVYACHPIVVGPDNREFSADFPGYATSVIESAFGGQAVCLFLNGAAGNINPLAFPYSPDRNISALAKASRLAGQPVTFRSHREARRLGNALGGEALRAAELVAVSPTGTVAGREFPVRVPLKAPADLERYFDHLAVQPTVRAALTGRSELEVEVQAIRIGAGVLVGLPGEPFVELGLELKRAAPDRPTCLVGYANDYVGYITTSEGYFANRYESVATPLGPAATKVLQAAATTVLRAVGNEP